MVSDTVLEPLAAADACLTQDERELGCCLLDIGGGTTELIVYHGGMVRHTAAIPVGGDHFTNDLAVGLRTPIPEAEKIKREHGCALRELLGEDQPIEIASVGDRPPRTVFSRMLCDIIEPRAQELLGADARRTAARRATTRRSPRVWSSPAAARACMACWNCASASSACRCASPRRAGWRECRRKSHNRNTPPSSGWRSTG